MRLRLPRGPYRAGRRRTDGKMSAPRERPPPIPLPPPPVHSRPDPRERVKSSGRQEKLRGPVACETRGDDGGKSTYRPRPDRFFFHEIVRGNTRDIPRKTWRTGRLVHRTVVIGTVGGVKKHIHSFPIRNFELQSDSIGK